MRKLSKTCKRIWRSPLGDSASAGIMISDDSVGRKGVMGYQNELQYLI